MGCGLYDENTAAELMEALAFNTLICSAYNVIHDMDRVADILFERLS